MKFIKRRKDGTFQYLIGKIQTKNGQMTVRSWGEVFQYLIGKIQTFNATEIAKMYGGFNTL